MPTQEEHYRIHKIIKLGDATQGNRLQIGFNLRLVIEEPLNSVRFHKVRVDAVDADAVRSQLERHHTRQVVQRRLGGAVDREVSVWLHCRIRRNVDDGASLATVDHAAGHHLRYVDDCLQVHVKDGVDFSWSYVEKTA